MALHNNTNLGKILRDFLCASSLNMASRMESHGMLGRIQLCSKVSNILQLDYEIEEREQFRQLFIEKKLTAKSQELYYFDAGDK